MISRQITSLDSKIPRKELNRFSKQVSEVIYNTLKSGYSQMDRREFLEIYNEIAAENQFAITNYPLKNKKEDFFMNFKESEKYLMENN